MIEVTFADVYISCLRWFIGLLAGSIVGGSIGAALAYAGKGSLFVSAILHFARAVPVLGLVPVIQYLFGISELGKFILIAWAVMFPVWISVETALANRLTELELSLDAIGVGGSDFAISYVFPRLLSGFFQGIQISIGVGWLSVVAAEFIGTFSSGFWSGGLGYKLFLAFDLNDWMMGIFALGLFGALGMISAWVWNALVVRLVFLRPGFDPLSWRKYG